MPFRGALQSAQSGRFRRRFSSGCGSDLPNARRPGKLVGSNFIVAAINNANRVRSRQGELDWEAALVWVDERFEYGEIRMIALAPRVNIPYCVALVDRGEVRRIISLRRANCREVKHYVENY
jgi:uncharacterized DUF497 family protein